MVASTMAPVPPTRKEKVRAAGHGCPARRSRRTPARYSPAATSTATSTGRSSVQDVTTRDSVCAGGPLYPPAIRLPATQPHYRQPGTAPGQPQPPGLAPVTGADLRGRLVAVILRQPPGHLGRLELVLLRPHGLQRAHRHEVAKLGGALQ